MSNFAYYTFTNGGYTGTLTGYTPGSGETGGAWLIPSYGNWAASAFAVDSSGRVYCTANGLAGYGMAYSSVTPPLADYSVEADFTCLSDVYSFSLIARMNSTGGAYCLQYRQYHGWSIGGITNGTISFGVGTTPTTGASAADMTVGQTIHAKLTVAGTTITATLSGSGFNGGTPITWSGTDATYTAAGNVGILANAGAPVTSTTGVHVTNFQASYTAPGPTTATVAGPTSGAVATASTYFTVTLNTAALTGGVSVSLASSGSGDSFGPNPLVIASGSTSGTFTLTPSTAPGARTITPTASGITFSPTTLTYTGLDVTPPVVATASVNTAGTTLTIGFTEAGSPPVLPASGATGFTLSASGGAVTLSSPAISGTTYTATTSRAIYNGEIITLAYSPGNVTDSATSPNALVAFSLSAVTNNSTAVHPLTAGVASFVSAGPGEISVTATAATGGTPTYTYQWQRNASGGAYANLSGATSLSLTDATAVSGTLYGYKCVATDSAGTPATATSNAVTAQIYIGGSLTGSASSVFGCLFIKG